MIILNGTCKNGVFIFEKPLPAELEGEKVKIEVCVTSHTNPDQTHQKRQQFIDWSRQFVGKLPTDYKFDREEIYSDRIKS